LTTEEVNQTTERLVEKYSMQVSKEIAHSVFIGQPRVPVLLARASFRPDVDVRTEQRTQFQRGRRNLLHTMLGLAAVSVTGLFLLKIASTPSSQPLPTTYASNAAATHSGQLLANAANIPPNQSLTFNDPAVGPIVLIHLDNGQFVAYSSICTHAGCRVQFDPSAKDLACPCHGAVYDPYNNAQVLAGPAPYPLQKIPIQYDSSTGNIYLTG
jgi:Rieske Fe-S protein